MNYRLGKKWTNLSRSTNGLVAVAIDRQSKTITKFSDCESTDDDGHYDSVNYKYI